MSKFMDWFGKNAGWFIPTTFGIFFMTVLITGLTKAYIIPAIEEARAEKDTVEVMVPDTLPEIDTLEVD